MTRAGGGEPAARKRHKPAANLPRTRNVHRPKSAAKRQRGNAASPPPYRQTKQTLKQRAARRIATEQHAKQTIPQSCKAR